MVFPLSMKFLADLHIHSRFSRATSKSLDPEQLDLWARKKGLRVVGTGDFTHPQWISELQGKLVEAEEGLYQLRPKLRKEVDSLVPPACPGPTRFMLSGEISCIYKKNGRTRKVHHLILMPDFTSVTRLNERLARIGNVSSDGRPILGLDSKDLLETVLEASQEAFFIPAHIWTPWFSLFGSKSGFDTLEECFEDLTPYIHALETGLSSDPPMNRLLSSLDRYTLVSNSDAHSARNLAREANLFDTELDYPHMVRAMTNGDGFQGTIEFFPEEGKYHLDGHRKCGVRLHPAETQSRQGVCPVCGRALTVGVLHRVHELADREEPRLSKDFISLIPLPEVLSELLDCGAAAKRVRERYEDLLSKLGPELSILIEIPLAEIEAAGGLLLAEAVSRMRKNEVIREEGFDGQYGTIRLFHEREKEILKGQMALFGLPTGEGSKPSHPRGGVKKGRQAKRKPVSLDQTEAADPILDPLNEEQKAALFHKGPHMLVVAGPGTGKTMTLTHKIAYLVREGKALPEHILALTFTRKAAREMSERISALLQDRTESQPTVTTFHAFCLDILKREMELTGLPRDFTLCSEWDAENLAKECLAESGKGSNSTKKFLRTLPKLKWAQVMGPPYTQEHRDLLPIFDTYQKRLRSMAMIDLDDLEVETLRLFRNHPEVPETYARKHPWIFVDEYQDTSPVQVELLKLLVRGGDARLFAIGDPDQSIYGFRGADVENFHRFATDFPDTGKVVLRRNYRSPATILRAAAAVIGKQNALESQCGGDRPVTVAPCTTGAEEAEMIVEQVERLIGGISYFSLDSGRVASSEEELSLGFGDIGVLFRLNAQGDYLEEAFSRAGIPYVRSGEAPLVARYPVNIIWRYFQTLQYPENPLYARLYREALPKGTRKLGSGAETLDSAESVSALIDRAVALHGLNVEEEQPAEALERLRELARQFEGDMALFLDTLSLERGIDHAILRGDRVALMSLHAAKGLQWPVVFITGCEDQLIPCTLFGAAEEEERRLFYVGITRTRSHLILSHVKRRALRGRRLQMKPSPFLDAIPKELCQLLDRRGWQPRKRAHRQLELFSG